MLNLYNPSLLTKIGQKNISKSERASILYHDFFDYPLTFAELIKWKVGKSILNIKREVNITTKKGYYYIEGREGLIYKRLLRKRISAKKMLLAKRTAKILSFVPSIKMIAITGSLAMNNSSEDSDIDFMVITKSESLWMTRVFTYLLIWLFGIQRRRPNDTIQKDRLCMNMWLDESDLIWRRNDRNIYTAHEIAQIVPLTNKDKTYEKFIYKNKWVLDYWPNSIRIQDTKILRYKNNRIKNLITTIQYLISNKIEKLAYKLQRYYMKKKITRELVTPTRALFHPQDWGKIIINRLAK